MHELFRVIEARVVAPFTIEVAFDDGVSRTIDLEPILAGDLYGPLRDPDFFKQVSIDPEVHTVVWPNGADFDPETLHNWPRYEAALIQRARRWAAARA